MADFDISKISEDLSEEDLQKAMDKVLDGLSDEEIEALMEELGIEDPFEDVITMTDDQGNEMDFAVLDEVQYEGEYYLVLEKLPEDLEEAKSEEPGDILVLKIANEGTEEEDYVPVTYDVAAAVFNIFLETAEEE